MLFANKQVFAHLSQNYAKDSGSIFVVGGLNLQNMTKLVLKYFKAQTTFNLKSKYMIRYLNEMTKNGNLLELLIRFYTRY